MKNEIEAYCVKATGAIKSQVEMIQFALSYPDRWHSYSPDYETVDCLCANVNLGILDWNMFRQFRLKSHFWAKHFLQDKGITPNERKL